MIAEGFDDYTVVAISGKSSTRMLEGYTHPRESRKLEALDTFSLSLRDTDNCRQPQPTSSKN
jgi:hypothetical protein